VFSLVRVTPRGGRPFELWVEAATGRFDRWTERDATRVRTVHLSDYRPVGGVWLPHAVRSTTGDPRYDDHYALERAVLDEAIADERFRPPPAPPPDFTIAGGRTATTLPFQLANHHVYVDVRLNGKGPFRLLADTGGSNIVTPAVARELGLEATGALEGRGAGERSEDVALTRIGEVEVGEARLTDQLFAVFPLAGLDAAEGVTVQGLIGYLREGGGDTTDDRYGAGNVGGTVLKRFTVTFDHGGQRIFFAPNAAAREPEPHDRAGLWLNAAAGGAFEVMDVVAGGPAAKAGVRVGDRIVAVDGTPAAKLTLPDLRERLRTSRPGTEVRLTLESAGTRRDVTVALADLV
jgi:hypothetical protein